MKAECMFVSGKNSPKKTRAKQKEKHTQRQFYYYFTITKKRDITWKSAV